jgi:hypothetical protein
LTQISKKGAEEIVLRGVIWQLSLDIYDKENNLLRLSRLYPKVSSF